MITEKVHPVTGEKYIEGAGQAIFESGIVCVTRELYETFQMSKEEIGALMQEWKDDSSHFKFDYRYALTTGILRRFQRKVAVPQQSSKAATVKTEARKQLISPASIILFVMSLAGVMSAIMSAYHSTKTLQLFGRPLAVGIITGTVMVMFSASAFTAARWFWREKGLVKGFSLIFVLLGIMVIAYSMLSTLTVNYTAWSAVDEEEKTEIVENSEELEAFNIQVQLKQEELNELVAEQERLENEADWWRNRSWNRYDELSKQITANSEKVKAVRAELTSLIASKPQISSKVTEQKEDVFTFLSGFIKIKPKTLRLFMQAVPAMFFDIIAPFALSCAIYLAERRNKEKEENNE